MPNYPNPQTLTGEQYTALTAHVETLVHPNTAQPQPPETARHLANSAITAMLVDPALGNPTARQLIDHYNEAFAPDDRLALIGLYSYYSVAQYTTKDHPSCPLPASLLVFLEDKARELGETDIQLEIAALLDGVHENQGATPVEALELLVDDFSYQFNTFNTDAVQELEDRLNTSLIALHKASSLEHIEDLNMLTLLRGQISLLRLDIDYQKFRTDEGMQSAKAQHDKDLLELRGNNFARLRQDVEEVTFFTDEGFAVARARHDKILLELHKGKPAELLTAIQNDRFMTDEGELLAKLQLDVELLRTMQQDKVQLQNALQDNLFLTTQGIGTAVQLAREANKR